MKVLDMSPALEHRRKWNEHFWDFEHGAADAPFTITATDSGGLTENDEKDGTVTLAPSDGTVADNDECYISSDTEMVLFKDDCPFVLEARVHLTEAATDDANWIFGVLSAPGANSLQDNGAGPPASYSGAVFFKEDGQTLWSCESSIAGTQQTKQLSADVSLDKSAWTAGTAAWQILRIESRPINSTLHDVCFYIDQGSGLILVWKGTQRVYTSATEKAIIFGVKNGGSTHDNVNKLDYILFSQRRG